MKNRTLIVLATMLCLTLAVGLMACGETEFTFSVDKVDGYAGANINEDTNSISFATEHETTSVPIDAIKTMGDVVDVLAYSDATKTKAVDIFTLQEGENIFYITFSNEKEGFSQDWIIRITRAKASEVTPNPDEGDSEVTPNPDEGNGEVTPNPDEGGGEVTPNPDAGNGEVTPNPDTNTPVYLKGIAVKSLANQYYIGTKSLGNGKLIATYSDGTVKIVDITANMVTGFDTKTVGTKTLTITYESVSTNYDIVVKYRERSIAVDPVTPHVYKVGDAFKGGMLTVNEADGSSTTIEIRTDMLMGFDTKSVGSKVVSVIYDGMITSFTINVQQMNEPIEPEMPRFTAKDAANDIADAIVKSLCAVDYDTTIPVGFSYALFIPTDTGESKINVAGYLDTQNAANTKVYFDYIENEYRVFSVSADSRYIYFDSMDVKRKFPGFKLAEKLVGQQLPDADDIAGGMIGSLPGIIFDLIMDLSDNAPFEHEVDSDFGAVDTIHGSLSGIAPVIGGIVDGIIPGAGAKLGEFLAKIKLELTATINTEGTIDYIDLNIINDNNGTMQLLTFESKLEQEYNPFMGADMFKIPNPKDTRYIETNLLNFNLEGTFALGNAMYDYTIKADINPFELLEKAVVSQTRYRRDQNGNVDTTTREEKLVFDVTRILDLEQSGMYINVSHRHNTATCNRMNDTEGTVFSLAFSKQAFGNNNFYMTVCPDMLFPNNLVSSAFAPEVVPEITAMLKDIAINDNLNGTLYDKIRELETAVPGSFVFNDEFLASVAPKGLKTFSVNPKAFIADIYAPINADPDGIMGRTALAGEPQMTVNPLAIAKEVYDFLASITVSTKTGLHMDTAPIMNALAAANETITNKLVARGGLMGEVANILLGHGTYLYVDKLFNAWASGSPSIDISYNKETSKYGDPNIKAAAFGTLFWNDTTMKESMELVLDVVQNGNISIGYSDQIKDEDVYDMNGNMRPMSENEWKAFMQAGKHVPVKYRLVNKAGSIREVSKDVTVNKIVGIDYTIKDREQEVLVLLPQLEGPLQGVGPASHYFKMRIKITSTDKIMFEDNDAELRTKTYRYGDVINPNLGLRITYSDGQAKVYSDVRPKKNAQLVAGNTVNAVSKFTLGYEVAGYTTEVNVRVLSNMDSAKHMLVKAGETFVLNLENDGITGNIDGNNVTIKDSSIINEQTVSLMWVNEPARKIVRKKYVLNEYGSQKFVGYDIIFDEAGDYELEVNVVGGFKETIRFHVELPLAV